MTEALNRDDVIRLLNGLGSERDEDVLEAARQVHARVAAAGATWEELLVPVATADEAENAEPAEDEDLVDASVEPPADKAAGDAESLRLIDSLLAKTDISPDLREELEGYKSDIAEGEFGEGDRRYLRAMSERLSKRR